MKTKILCIISLALAAAFTAHAAEAPPPKKPAPAGSPVMAKYDADHNGTINVDESYAIRSAFTKDPADPLLKPLDINGDGVLSDGELMKIAPKKPAPKKPAAKPKKK